MRNIPVCLAVMLWLALGAAFGGSGVERYNVVWTSPSRDAYGTMPLGNGDIGLNAWIDENGDLIFYISKTDSWGDNGRLLKVGRLQVALEPRPAVSPFEQTLSLTDATLVARYGDGAAELRLWVDANQPVIHVTVESRQPVAATAFIELWRKERETLPSIEVSDVMLHRSKPGRQHAPTVVESDTVLKGQSGRIGWFHHNAKSVGPAMTAAIQGLKDFPRQDPLLHRTFGAVVRAEGGTRLDDLRLRSPAATTHRFSFHVLTRHPATPAQWLAAMDETIASTEKSSFAQRRAAHEAWWRSFWDRSWIHVTATDPSRMQGLIPANAHPVRIGVDPSGGNRFAGEIGRLSVFGMSLDAEVVAKLAKLERTKPLERAEGVLATSVPKLHAPLPGSEDWRLEKGLTIEAWVKPGKLPSAGARIVDKITPGGSDGFLLDTWPGNSLRLIVGNAILQKRDALPSDMWTHVAATVAAGGIQLYVNGTVVAEKAVDALDDAAVVSRAYALQRFITACAGRGAFPIKFNGTLFTVPHPGAPGDADYRRWGPGYWWQNTRLPYISMCASGDFDLMQPLFRMYGRDLMPLFRYRTRHYFGHGGIFIPECIYFWGDVFSETYGWTPFEQRKDKLQASGWHKWEWVSGPELACLMLDYYDHTLDETFLADTALPLANEVITFFDQHYKADERGKLVMHPSQALETWWDCTNPMPEVAGLHATTARLLALPKNLTTDKDRAFWTQFQKKLPELPTREVKGTRMLAPATRFAAKRNIENPELYAVYPFRLVSFEKENRNLGIGALRHRWDRGHSGWRQDDIFMACLGLADEARDNLVRRARAKHAGSRFPAFWGPNYDWIPDQDHGGVLMKALQAMVLQTDGRKILLLPAWPKDWNVAFRLHAPQKTVIEGAWRGGRLERLNITPESRREDVVVVPTNAPGGSE